VTMLPTLYTLYLHDALPIYHGRTDRRRQAGRGLPGHGYSLLLLPKFLQADGGWRRIVWMSKGLKERVKEGIDADMMDKIATEDRSEEHTSELQSRENLVCRL